MQLKNISRIVVQFSPFAENTSSVREFLARITSKRARESNPGCQVVTRVRCVLPLKDPTHTPQLKLLLMHTHTRLLPCLHVVG
jgi:hypothetical protein